MQKLFLIILFSFFSLQHLSAQENNYIDSLEKNWSASSCDTCKVNTLNELAKYFCNADIDKSKKYASTSVKLSKKINFKKGLGNAYNNLANAYYFSGDFTSALDFHQQALVVRKSIGDKMGMGASFLGIGNVHYAHQNYDLAQDYMNKSLKYLREVKFEKGIRTVLSCLGNVSLFKNDYPKALELFTQVALESEKSNDIALLASSTNGIGIVYFRQNEYPKAIPYYLKAYDLQTKINNLSGASASSINLGMIYSNIGKYDSALIFLHKGEELALKTGAREWQRNVYHSLGKTYFAKKMYKEAYEYFSGYTELNDSLVNEAKDKTVAELEIKYKTKELKSQNEIVEKKVSIEKLKTKEEKTRAEKKLFAVIFIAATLLVLLLGVYLFYRHRQKEKLSTQQKDEQLMRHRAVIEAEEKERMRIARDLHDGLGQTLSTARINVAGLETIIDEKHKKIFLNSLQLIDNACKDVREISHNMMPEALTRLGFLPAVRELAGKINDSGLLKVIVMADNFPEKLGDKFDVSLYRIIQEVLSNMIRHAQAKQISIKLALVNQRIQLVIEDDGIGFDVGKIETSDGIGWKNIFFRVFLLNGKIDMHSNPGKGTGININLSLT